LKLWGAQGISAFGTQITLFALPLVAILTLDASAFEVAVLTAVELVPFALLGIPAGVWVDRLSRRPVLVLADVGRAALLLSIPVAYWLDALTLAQLYVVGLAAGVLTVFFTLAYQAYVPVLVAREDLIGANARFEATETLARFGGPASAGGLVAVLSAPIVILADAVSFVASGALILSIRHREPRRRASATRPAFWGEVRAGARFALRDPYVRPILVATAIVNIGFNASWAVLLVFAVRELELGAGLAGLVLSAGEIGGLVGALVTTGLARAVGTGRVIIGSAALFGPALLVVALAPESSPLPFLVVGLAAASFAGVVYNASTVGLRQARVPLELQGRVVGFNRTIVWGVSPLGALLGGALAAGAGVRVAMIAGGAIACFSVLPALASPLRGLRGLPEDAAP
jgi:MFS family permease